MCSLLIDGSRSWGLIHWCLASPSQTTVSAPPGATIQCMYTRYYCGSICAYRLGSDALFVAFVDSFMEGGELAPAEMAAI